MQAASARPAARAGRSLFIVKTYLFEGNPVYVEVLAFVHDELDVLHPRERSLERELHFFPVLGPRAVEGADDLLVPGLEGHRGRCGAAEAEDGLGRRGLAEVDLIVADPGIAAGEWM